MQYAYHTLLCTQVCKAIAFLSSFQLIVAREPSSAMDSDGDYGSGDYGFDDNEMSSVQFSFTNVENNRSEENVIELPGTVKKAIRILQFSFLGLYNGGI